MMLRFVLLIVAVLCGSAAAWVAIQLRPHPVVVAEPPSAKEPMRDVLVAKNDLRPGQRLSEKDMDWAPRPESMVNPDYDIIRSKQPHALEALSGMFVQKLMIQHDPIRKENLASRSYIATNLPSGKRAVAVRTSPENTAGGLIHVNDWVDVMSTEGPTAGEQRTSHIATLIATNVKVLAIEQIVDEGKEEFGKAKAPVTGKTATLMVDLEQAELITAAQAKGGTLSLVIRSAADEADNSQAAKTIRIISGGHAEVRTLTGIAPVYRRTDSLATATN
jgi:pilus assembly protein CpaB